MESNEWEIKARKRTIISENLDIHLPPPATYKHSQPHKLQTQRRFRKCSLHFPSFIFTSLLQAARPKSTFNLTMNLLQFLIVMVMTITSSLGITSNEMETTAARIMKMKRINNYANQ
jgi:hypothetical protein